MTECARCGDCCERVSPNISVPDLRRKLANPYYAGRARHQAELITKMLVDRVDPPPPSFAGDIALRPRRPTYRCENFDTETRLCIAHDERPRMCSDYPWYPPGGPLPTNKIPLDFSPRCSFIADIRPMLPLEVLS